MVNLHLLLTFFFTIPFLLFLWGGWGKLLFAKRKIILRVVLSSTAYLSVFYFLAIKLSCWHYSSLNISGIFFLNMPVEDLVLFLAISLTISSAVVVFSSFFRVDRGGEKPVR